MKKRVPSATKPAKQTRVERILEPFGAKHAAGLIEFFDKIATSDFDLVIFMARKSLCIYRLMELCGVRKISMPVVSDALLDSDPDLFKGKRVLVVDDTLFVGTTLADAKERLETTQAAQIEFWVYCADGETWSEETFRPEYIHSIMSANEIIEFCAAECRAMINAGIPYLTDFSASKRIRLTPSQLDKAIKPINWNFFDVSSQYHEKSKVKYYSAIPDSLVNQEMKKILGSAIFELIDLAKIRAFAAWSGRAYEVTFVPVVTFCPTDRKSLGRAVNAISEAFGVDKACFASSSVMEKMRFMQYIIGALFMRFYWDYLESVTDLAPDAKFSFDWCSSIFSNSQSDQISQAIADIYSNDAPYPKIHNDAPKLVRSEPAEIRKETTDDIELFLEEYFSGDGGTDFGHTPLSDLTAIFLRFQAKFETAARNEVRDKVKNPKYRDRLKRGIAWRALSSYLLKKYGRKHNRWERNILSLVLDRLIDFGIAVPIISAKGDSVYRAYRHGEDVKFGVQEESLVFNLLAGFQSARELDGIEGTYIEKLIVILLRVGMNEEWLNLWYSNSGRDTLVRVGYHLQGAVPISPRREDELVPEGETSWLSQRLLKTGTLSATPNPKRPGKLFHLGDRPEAAHIRSDAPRTAKALGNTIGKACVEDGQERNETRPLATEDLIVLTSCSNALDTTGAVVAELKIFVEWYESQANRVLRGDFTNPKSRAFQIRVKGSKGAQAANSAIWKLEKYANNAVDTVKSKVLKLEQYDDDWIIREGYWEAVFHAFERPIEDSEDKKLARIRAVAYDIIQCLLFLVDSMDRMVDLARAPDRPKLDGFSEFLRSKDLPILVPTPNLREIADELSQPAQSATMVRKKLSGMGRTLDGYARSLCSLASEEASAAESVIAKANLRLSRVQYSYMVWYDILDVRVRKKATPDATSAYSEAVDEFRKNVNSMLSSAQERIRENKGDLFCDNGDIRSINDEKHIFLNVPGGAIVEGNRLLCDIVRVAETAGVSLRLLAVPTNLRGEYVYLNRGSVSIDGDFKSHIHTLIQDLTHHEVEKRLENGESVVWMLSDMIGKFRPIGSVRFTSDRGVTEREVDVNIKGFRVKNRVSYLRSSLR